MELLYLAANNCYTLQKKNCPNFQKHRSLKHGGWSHITCSKCETLRREIKGAKDNAQRHIFVERLNFHNDHAYKCKKAYYSTRSKAVWNLSENHCSMICDAAGGTGSTYSPRFRTTTKDEPQRHEMCKIKCTFVKVHGVGSLIAVSLPELETQGANLTFECALQGIILYMEQRNVTKINNLYVQLDNVSGNKSYSLLAAFSALVVLGICKKVKVSYLQVC
jgi:hypothetical protein